MISFMTSHRLPLLATASTLCVLLLAGCAAPHDLSLAESCKQWTQLSEGKWDVVRGDLVDAEPKMHEAVAKQVLIYIQALGSPGDNGSEMTDEDIDAAVSSRQRLISICGK